MSNIDEGLRELRDADVIPSARLREVLRTHRYIEGQLSGDGSGGDFERGYRVGWTHAMGHVAREMGFDVSDVEVGQ